MAKLSKLRRTILRDPEKWFSVMWNKPYRAKAAWRWAGRWVPTYSGGYRNFVRKVLLETGITVK